MHHKSGTLRTAAMGAMANLVYFAPGRVVRVALERFWEAMEAANSVHQIAMAIRWVASALLPGSKVQCAHVAQVVCMR